jgi:hypothetical protein
LVNDVYIKSEKIIISTCRSYALGLDEFTIDNYDKTEFNDCNVEMGDNRLGMYPSQLVQIHFEDLYLKLKLDSFLTK